MILDGPVRRPRRPHSLRGLRSCCPSRKRKLPPHHQELGDDAATQDERVGVGERGVGEPPEKGAHDGGDGEHTPLFEQVQNGGGGGGGSRGGVSEPAQPHCCAVCCTFFSAVAVILLLFFSCMVQSPFVHPEGSLHWTNQARSPPPFPDCVDTLL